MYGIVALSSANTILHVCLYPYRPTTEDGKALAEELASDEEFNMTHLTIGEDYILAPAEGELLNTCLEYYDIDDPDALIHEVGKRMEEEFETPNKRTLH